MDLKGNFWKIDQVLIDAQRSPGWSQFHRQCGNAGIFFHIERKRGHWEIEAVHWERQQSGWQKCIVVSAFTASHPIAGCLAAFDAARASADPIGRALDPAIALHLRPGEPVMAADPDIDALLGGAAVMDPLAELVG